MTDKIYNKIIYVHGEESIGWSIDHDREHLVRALNDIGISMTRNLFRADIIFSVWWNRLIDTKLYWLKRIMNKKFIACVTNDLNHQADKFWKARSIIDYWVYANTKQRDFLLFHGIPEDRTFYNPFYVDEKIFADMGMDKQAISEQLNISHSPIKSKFLIGSFQRDSLGAELSKAKWQKNPDMIVEIFRKLDSDRFMLVLAGPRRHYLITACNEYNIPYIFLGDESAIVAGIDDMSINNLSLETINLLYNLVDLYIVTSKSEGGPKALIEAPLTGTAVLSTNVGMAVDILDERCIADDVESFVHSINALESDSDYKRDIEHSNSNKIRSINNCGAYKRRVMGIIECVVENI